MPRRIKSIPMRGRLVPQKFGRATPKSEAERSRQRRDAAPYRKWYGLQRWKDLSERCRVEAKCECAICGFKSAAKGAMVADHIEPHRGDPRLFWDFGNLQCLCKRCHDTVKQREEANNLGGVVTG